jgi:hypothetical protein
MFWNSGETYRESDGTFVVLVDRRTNLRDEVLRDNVFHEMSHVATWRQEDDPHGSGIPGVQGWNQGESIARPLYESTMSGIEKADKLALQRLNAANCVALSRW